MVLKFYKIRSKAYLLVIPDYYTTWPTAMKNSQCSQSTHRLAWNIFFTAHCLLQHPLFLCPLLQWIIQIFTSKLPSPNSLIYPKHNSDGHSLGTQRSNWPWTKLANCRFTSWAQLSSWPTLKLGPTLKYYPQLSNRPFHSLIAFPETKKMVMEDSSFSLPEVDPLSLAPPSLCQVSNPNT